LLGLAIAGIKTSTVAMIGDYYAGAERNRIIGWQGSAMKVGGVVFMLLGGWLANYSWQTPFLGYLLAFALLPSSLIALAGGLPRQEPRKEADAAVVSPALFWPASWVFLSAFLASGLFFVTPVQLPFFLKNTLAATPFQMGAAIAAGNTVGAFVSLGYHRFRARMSFTAIHGLIFLAMSAGYFILTQATTYSAVLCGMCVAGIGFGLYVPNHSSWILTIVSARRRGFGAGLVTTAMFLGQFAAPILIQPLINPADSASVWRSLSIILLALALLYFTISTLRRKRVNKTPEIAVTT
jgi:MFS family permease